MILEGRLKLIADLVPQCDTLADVGTDHGYIPVYCTQQGKCRRAIAMDVNAQPLERADANIKKYNLTQSITTRLSDGVQQLSPGEADTIVIAGMGGQLIMNILHSGRDIITEGTLLILQPMLAAKELREYLYDNGYDICGEYVSREENKYYNIITAKRGAGEHNDNDIYIGRNLEKNSPDVYKEYLRYKIRVNEKIFHGLEKSASDESERMGIVEKELNIFREALNNEN